MNGNVVGNIDLYHNSQPSIAAEMHLFMFKAKRIIKIDINMHIIKFCLIPSCLIKSIIKLIIKNHKNTTYIMKSLQSIKVYSDGYVKYYLNIMHYQKNKK